MNITEFGKITVGVLQGYFPNKSVLDKLGDSNGSLTYDSDPIITDLSDYYTKSQVYTKSEMDTALATKQNAASAIDTTVNNLQNYYLKSETYTKTEVNNLISAIPTMAVSVVQTLPTTDIDTHTIYLVANIDGADDNIYDEYIRVNNSWEHLGQVNTSVDLATLSDYIAKADFNYTSNSDIDTLMSTYPITTNAITNGNLQSNIMPTASADYAKKIVQYTGSTTPTYTNGYFYECVNNNGTYSWVQKDVQDAATGGAEYPSGGTTGQALVKKSNADNDVEWGDVAPNITIDSALSSTSENPVQNKVVKSALDGKQNTLTQGTNITISGNTISATDTTYSTVTKSAAGLCPQLPNESTTTKYLRQDGTWTAPPSGVSAYNDLSDRPSDVSDISEIITPLPSTPFKGIKYSTKEQVIGEWIDGKPLYQKTFAGLSISAPRGSWVSIDTTLANIGNFVNCIVLAENNLLILPCTVYPTDASAKTGVRIQNSSSDETTRTVNTVTVQYTKTTD